MPNPNHPQQRRQPKNRQELLEDIASHPERGLIKGEPILNFDTQEYRAFVRRSSYSLALQHDVGLGQKKTGIAQTAVFLFVTNPVIRTLNPDLLDQDFLADDGRKKADFRCYLPVRMVAEFERIRKGLNLSRGEALGYALEMFGRTQGLQDMYAAFVQNVASEKEVDEGTVRSKISGGWKALGRGIREEDDDFESEKTIS